MGSNTFPGRVWKGKRLAGRYGNERVTIENLKILKIIPEKNLLIVSGSVPGPI
jgi:large subunit ribosomal protein L3